MSKLPANFPLESVYNWYRDLVSNPKYRWWVIAGSLLYIISPFDILPDVFPIVGQIDDAVVITILAAEISQLLRDRTAQRKPKDGAEPTEPNGPTVVDVEVV